MPSLPRPAEFNYRKLFAAARRLWRAASVAVAVILFPVFWMVVVVAEASTELFARNMTLLPIDWTLENYRNVWFKTPFPSYFWNSFKVAAISTTAITVAISIYAAYAIARIRFRGRYAYRTPAARHPDVSRTSCW